MRGLVVRKSTLVLALFTMVACCLASVGCGSADDTTTSVPTTSVPAATTETSSAYHWQIDEELIGVWQPIDTGSEAVLEFTRDGRMLILSEDPSQESIEGHYRAEDGMLILVNHLGVDEVIVPYSIEGGILSITDGNNGIVETYQKR